MKSGFYTKNIKIIDLAYKQMLPNKKAHKITTENMF